MRYLCLFLDEAFFLDVSIYMYIFMPNKSSKPGLLNGASTFFIFLTYLVTDF